MSESDDIFEPYDSFEDDFEFQSQTEAENRKRVANKAAEKQAKKDEELHRQWEEEGQQEEFDSIEESEDAKLLGAEWEEDAKSTKSKPAWLSEKTDIALGIESAFWDVDHDEKILIMEGLESHFATLVSSGSIVGFEKTNDGYKVMLNSKEQFHLDLNKQQILLKGFGFEENSLKAIYSVLALLGAKAISLGNIHNRDHCYAAWKSAQENNLEVTGVGPTMQSSFKSRFNQERLEASYKPPQ